MRHPASTAIPPPPRILSSRQPGVFSFFAAAVTLGLPVIFFVGCLRACAGLVGPGPVREVSSSTSTRVADPEWDATWSALHAQMEAELAQEAARYADPDWVAAQGPMQAMGIPLDTQREIFRQARQLHREDPGTSVASYVAILAAGQAAQR